MFGFLKKLFGNSQETGVRPEQAPYKVEPPVAPAPVAEPAPAPQRAKDAKGKFVADDPATPVNEAWKGGKAPAKKPAAIKASSAKKPATKKKTSK